MASQPQERATAGKPRLAVVCSFFDEEAAVDPFYARLRAVLAGELSHVEARLVFVDDGSTDATRARLERLAEDDPRIRVLALSRNFGQQAALSAGLDVARGDAVVLMDSDLQHPPEVLPAMVARWLEGHAVVSAVRRDTADSSLLKRLSSRAFYRLFNLLSDVPLVPGAADFTLLSREAARVLRRMPERHRFLRGMVAWTGFEAASVPYVAPARVAGRSKYGLRRMAALALDAVCSFTVRPIRVAAKVGLTVAGLGLVYLAYAVVRALLYGDVVPGWASILCTVIILGGMNLFFLGVVGEYVARVYQEVKSRPIYVLAPRRRRGRPGRAARRDEHRGEG
jgi:dolichol-phosphate mannosyltransferase